MTPKTTTTNFIAPLFRVRGTRKQKTFRLDEHENLWEYYFECFARLKQKVDVAFRLTSEGFGQELSPGLDAIREALVNMLMHADYFSPGHPRIRIFTNKIEFYNPGGLPKPYEELKGKDISLPRNPILAKLFRMVKLAENAGFGFDKMDTKWMEYNHTTPVYDLSFDSTIVKFQLETIEETSVKTSVKISDNFGKVSERIRNDLRKSPVEKEKIIFNLQNVYEDFILYLERNFGLTSEQLRNTFGITSENIRDDFGKHLEKKMNSRERMFLLFMLIVIEKTITAEKAAEILKVSGRTIETYFSTLKENGMIDRVGSRKEGYWKVKQNINKSNDTENNNE